MALAHGGEIMTSLHTVTTLASLMQALFFSYRSFGLSSALIAAISAVLYQSEKFSYVLLLKTAVSAAVIQLAILVGTAGSFTPGEASFLAQIVVVTKYVWSLEAWAPLGQVTYVLWVSTALGIILMVSLKQFVPAFCNPLLLFATISSLFIGGLRILKFDLNALVNLCFEALQAEGSSMVLIFWFIGLVLVSLLSFVFNDIDITEDDKFLLQMLRKSYHLIALIMFMPAYLYNATLMKTGLVAASCLFLALETVRCAMPESSLGAALVSFTSRFVNESERDSMVVVPHLLLLIGCALPMLIETTPNSIHAFAGVFALCITDASAALIGSLSGEHHWPNSRKTMEGTLGSIVVTYVFLSFITEVVTFEQTVPELPAILGYSLMLPLWEAVSDQNDNLTLPVVALALSRLLF